MNITLVPELEKFVQAQIESGAYKSESAVLNEALRLFSQRKKAMDDFIQVALDEAERGEFFTPEEAWNELEEIIVAAERRNAV